MNKLISSTFLFLPAPFISNKWKTNLATAEKAPPLFIRRYVPVAPLAPEPALRPRHQKVWNTCTTAVANCFDNHLKIVIDNQEANLQKLIKWRPWTLCDLLGTKKCKKSSRISATAVWRRDVVFSRHRFVTRGKNVSASSHVRERRTRVGGVGVGGVLIGGWRGWWSGRSGLGSGPEGGRRSTGETRRERTINTYTSIQVTCRAG